LVKLVREFINWESEENFPKVEDWLSAVSVSVSVCESFRGDFNLLHQRKWQQAYFTVWHFLGGYNALKTAKISYHVIVVFLMWVEILQISLWSPDGLVPVGLNVRSKLD
jgi:hypothetical protein